MFNFDLNFEQKFKEEYQILLNNGCTYISYIIHTSDDHIYRMSSDRSWLLDTYIKQHMIQHCPLRKMVYSNASMLIPWYALSLTKKQAEIMDARYQNNQRNGITLCCNRKTHREIIALATEDKNFDLARTYLMGNNVIKECLQRIRNASTVTISL